MEGEATKSDSTVNSYSKKISIVSKSLGYYSIL